MKLLSLFSAPKIKASSAPDVSHIENRDMPQQIIGADLYAYRSIGITDVGAPSTQQVRQAYRSLIYAFAKLRAQGVAKSMVNATVERYIGQDEWKEVEITHPWVKLLNNPCPTLSNYDFWRWVQSAKDLSKGAFLYVERSGNGVPIALHPIYKVYGDVLAVPALSGGIESWIFERTDGARFNVAYEDIIWIQHTSIVSPYESMSLLEAAAYESDISLYQSIYQKNQYAGGGIPRSQIVSNQDYNTGQRERLLEQLKEQYGVLSKGGIPFMPKGTEFKGVAVSARDMEFVLSSKMNREVLERIFGIPEGLFALAAGRANAEAAKYTFADTTIQPEADALASQLSYGLRKAFNVIPEVRIEVRASDIIPMDADLMLRKDEMQLRSGLRLINELRQRDGYDPYAGIGDVPLVASGLQNLNNVVAVNNADTQNNARERMVRAVKKLQELSENEDEDSHSIRDALWRSIEVERIKEEEIIRLYFVEFFNRQEDSIIENMLDMNRNITDVMTIDKIFDIRVWVAVLRNEFPPIVRRLLQRAYRVGSILANYSGVLDLTRPVVNQSIESVVNNVFNVNETTANSLAKTLQEGIDARETMNQLTERVKDVMMDAKTNRARTIARTTATNGFGAGQQIAFKDAGVTAKEWLSQRDDEVRVSHQIADGQRVGINEQFLVGESLMSFPADPDAPAGEVINCRCSMLPVM